MISAPTSGAGKTTVTLGLLRALVEEGLAVQPYKVGPDYIDPAFHRAACGRASFNLDSWAMDGGLLDAIAAEGQDADIIMVEGVMGLFDGAIGHGVSGNGASVDIARRMGWPVVLVIDVSGQAQSAAAIALGFRQLGADVPSAGVILNRVASPRHERLVRSAMEAAGIPVLGALPRRPDMTLPERHLGLVQATEHAGLDALLSNYAALIRAHVDLPAIRQAAATQPRLIGQPMAMPPPAQRIALAQDAAFSFTYPHLLTAWQRMGAQIVPFSPLADEAPAREADLVWLPGGYPELHAGRLAAADRFRTGLCDHAKTRPVYGECGGYMVLGEGLIDKDGEQHRMAGLLGLVTSHAERRLHLGYRQARLLAPAAGFEAGASLRGHEFHYSTIVEQPDPPLAHVTDSDGEALAETGSCRGPVAGTYFHLIAPDAA
jgi:cobyrinic acid a,c-diamide synthase